MTAAKRSTEAVFNYGDLVEIWVEVDQKARGIGGFRAQKRCARQSRRDRQCVAFRCWGLWIFRTLVFREPCRCMTACLSA